MTEIPPVDQSNPHWNEQVLRKKFDYNPVTGDVLRYQRGVWTPVRDLWFPKKVKVAGYRCRATIDSYAIDHKAEVVAWILSMGDIYQGQLMHTNFDPKDNRLDNLFLVTGAAPFAGGDLLPQLILPNTPYYMDMLQGMLDMKHKEMRNLYDKKFIWITERTIQILQPDTAFSHSIPRFFQDRAREALARAPNGSFDKTFTLPAAAIEEAAAEVRKDRAWLAPANYWGAQTEPTYLYPMPEPAVKPAVKQPQGALL